MGISLEEGIISNVLKVKVFSEKQDLALEELVNSWLSNNKVLVRQVIYQHSITTEYEVFTCMVIYT